MLNSYHFHKANHCHGNKGKSVLQVPDTGMSQYWWILEHFFVHQYCPKMWYLRSLEHVGGIQKQTILECQNGLVLSNTCVPVSGTWSALFPKQGVIVTISCNMVKGSLELSQLTALWYINDTEECELCTLQTCTHDSFKKFQQALITHRGIMPLGQ